MLLLLSLFDKNVLITLVEGDATLVEHQSCCPGADLLPLCRSWTLAPLMLGTLSHGTPRQNLFSVDSSKKYV